MRPPMIEAGPPRVAVGLLTFHRPDRLRGLLPLLLEQLDDVSARGLISEGSVIVVDNDAGASAQSVVEAFGRPDLVRYVVETQRGISYGRNRALDEAADEQVLVFIDDDETPRPGWLGHLLTTYATYGADAVVGGVVSQPDGALDPFVAAGGFLDRSHRVGVATGDHVSRAATNNLLLDMRFVRQHDLRFDWRFGISGGSDSLFTSQLTKQGGLMVWCAEAVVVDHVPADRMTPEWILKRSYNMASALIFVELSLCDSPLQRARFRVLTIVRETARMGQGLTLLLRSYPRRSLSDRARGLRAIARARGAASGLVGRRSVHYPDPA